MKKLNKKGFTLIEMLVVIAIIAILVAIIIPTVSSATKKAAAATDAANMRSYLAEIVVSYLSNDGNVTVDTNNAVTCKIKAPAMKAISGEGGVSECAAGTDSAPKPDKWVITYSNGDFTLTYDGKTIDQIAALAGSTTDQSNPVAPSTQVG